MRSDANEYPNVCPAARNLLISRFGFILPVEVDHVGRADRDDLQDSRAAAAVSQSGPAERNPPPISSESSVVVMPRTPANTPSRTSDSITSPPVPVAPRGAT